MVRPLIVVGLSAAVATFYLAIKLVSGDELWSPLVRWPTMFALVGGVLALQIGLNRRWAEAAMTAGLIALVFLVTNALRFHIYAAITGANGVMIIPVTP